MNPASVKINVYPKGKLGFPVRQRWLTLVQLSIYALHQQIMEKNNTIVSMDIKQRYLTQFSSNSQMKTRLERNYENSAKIIV